MSLSSTISRDKRRSVDESTWPYSRQTGKVVEAHKSGYGEPISDLGLISFPIALPLVANEWAILKAKSRIQKA